jgi:ABC-type phosphate transport system substrate-binding protein
MKDFRSRRLLQLAVLAGLLFCSAAPLFSALKNWAVVTSAGSKLQDVPIADLAKLCKGTQKKWPDGKPFTLVIHDPDSADMRYAIEKLFGVEGANVKALLAKVNETRKVVVIVDSDEELFHAVQAIPGAIGLVDVYSINSAVKVLRVDGKLPFDAGYELKGN